MVKFILKPNSERKKYIKIDWQYLVLLAMLITSPDYRNILADCAPFTHSMVKISLIFFSIFGFRSLYYGPSRLHIAYLE
jgi:hypothetical protein